MDFGRNYFRNPALLEFVAENPVRRGKMPAKVVDVTRAILDAGVDHASLNEALMLVATRTVARESGMQVPLISLLCDAGADAASALRPAVICAELDTSRRCWDAERGWICRLPRR